MQILSTNPRNNIFILIIKKRMVVIMSNKNVLKKINSRRFFLNKISANRLAIEPKDETIDISEETYFEIIENNNEYLSLRVITKIFIEPEALFSIEMEHIINYRLLGKMVNEEIDDNIEELLFPLASEISYITSSVTQKLIGTHIVLPPTLNIIKQ